MKKLNTYECYLFGYDVPTYIDIELTATLDSSGWGFVVTRQPKNPITLTNFIAVASIANNGGNMVGFMGRKIDHKLTFTDSSISVTWKLKNGYSYNACFLSTEEFSAEIETKNSKFTYIQAEHFGNKHQSVFA